MRNNFRLEVSLICSLLLLGLAGSARAQDVLIPAGTLLHCTLDEPNLSSATAAVGDPVICHMRSIQEFGHVVFPRGTYLGGHIEATKEPGHFVGKGYIKLQFDRIGLPTSDLPVPSKIIAAKGFKVDKDGDIKGHGHATRDVVEWMFPPLWPWKLIMLPARGPRPTLKGEEQITLRLMDDVMVPRNLAATDYYPNRPPYFDASEPNLNHVPSYDRVQPTSSNAPSGMGPIRPVPRTPSAVSVATATPASYVTPSAPTAAPAVAAATAEQPGDARLTMIALKSGEIQGVRSYRVDKGVLNYVLPSGMGGSVYVSDIDWRTTTQVNSDKHIAVPTVATTVGSDAVN
jgi:hypothetical protein